jgi:hypothetical protein
VPEKQNREDETLFSKSCMRMRNKREENTLRIFIDKEGLFYTFSELTVVFQNCFVVFMPWS